MWRKHVNGPIHLFMLCVFVFLFVMCVMGLWKDYSWKVTSGHQMTLLSLFFQELKDFLLDYCLFLFVDSDYLHSILVYGQSLLATRTYSHLFLDNWVSPKRPVWSLITSAHTAALPLLLEYLFCRSYFDLSTSKSDACYGRSTSSSHYSHYPTNHSGVPDLCQGLRNTIS